MIAAFKFDRRFLKARRQALPLIAINGVDIYYEAAGQGHPVVFIHGHSLDCRMWNEQVERIAQSYTVVRYDLRGHGRSGSPATGYDRSAYAAELLGLIQGLGLTKPSLVGHSLGGGIAIEYALRNPARLSSLVLVDSNLEGLPPPERVQQTVEKQKALVRREGVSPKFIRAAMMGPLFQGIRQSPGKAALVREMLAAWSGASWKDEASYSEPALRQIDRLGELRIPVLSVVGEFDSARFHRISDIICANVIVNRREIVAGAGHLVPLESPEAFNDIVLDFLGGAVGKALL